MRRQDLILNLLLLASLGALGWKLHHDWKDYALRNGPQALQTRPITAISIPAVSPVPDYTAVSRLNPFQADRNDTIQENAQAKPAGPPPLFYGSIIMGGTRFALMATEQSPKPEPISEGSTFAGYQLARVLPESIVLVSAAGSQEVMLYNAMMRLHRQSGKTSGASAPAAVRTTTTPVSSGTSVPDQAAAPAAEPNTSASASTPANQGSPAPAAAVPAGKQVIDTPFGPVTIDKRKP